MTFTGCPRAPGSSLSLRSKIFWNTGSGVTPSGFMKPQAHGLSSATVVLDDPSWTPLAPGA
jgi:hypothetical protein